MYARDCEGKGCHEPIHNEMETISTTTKVTVISSSDGESDDDANGIATTLPVIIQIKVKPDRRRHNKWRLTETKEFAKNDERHRSERYLSYRNDFGANSELTAEYWRQAEDTRENWQIFERKPCDQFNQSLRETLSKSLSEAVTAGSQVTSPRELLQQSSGSECNCDLEEVASAADFFSEIPTLPMPSHPSSTASSRCSSVIEQKVVKPLPFSKVIEVTNPNGTLERDAARERLQSNEKTGTFISARQSPKWIKVIEQPNKWMRTQEKNINFQEPLICAKQSPIKSDKRPKTSKRIAPELQLRSVADAKAARKLPTTVVRSPAVLDYRKMVNALHNATVAEKCILLEALRWRLTKSKDSVPSETIKQFSTNDLLQLRANRLLPKLLWPLDESENALVQQNCVASLLNAIVSYKSGREYFDGISMFDTLTANALGNSLIEKKTADNLIAVMAKLSINAYHRHNYGKSGLLEWLLNRLSDAEYSASEYFFKYAFRLLLNLTSDPKTVTLGNDRTVELFTLILRIYERPEQQPNREIIRKVLSNLYRCTDAPAKQINLRGILMERIKNSKDLTEKAAIKEWLNEIAQNSPAASYHMFDRDVAYNDVSEVEIASQTVNNVSLNGEAFLILRFTKRPQAQSIDLVELSSQNEKSNKHVKSHRLLLPLLKHTFSENTMDFRNFSHVPRIFPMRKFPAILKHEYRKLDFSSTLESLPQKRVEWQDFDSKTFTADDKAKEKCFSHIQRKSSPIPFTVLQTSDESQRESPYKLDPHTEFKTTFVEPIIDSIIETIASVHTKPTESLKLSDSDSEVIVKEFTRDSPPNHPTQSPVKIAKRSNIPIRIPSIETDLQALIKSVDDASKFNGTKSIGADKRIDTHATNGNNPLKMDSGDEKDVVIKLYDRSQSSSFDSAEAIRNKLPPNKLVCAKSGDDGG